MASDQAENVKGERREGARSFVLLLIATSQLNLMQLADDSTILVRRR